LSRLDHELRSSAGDHLARPNRSISFGDVGRSDQNLPAELNGEAFGPGTVHHAAAACACRTRLDDNFIFNAVVDGDLRVQGTDSLYVCDGRDALQLRGKARPNLGRGRTAPIETPWLATRAARPCRSELSA